VVAYPPGRFRVLITGRGIPLIPALRRATFVFLLAGLAGCSKPDATTPVEPHAELSAKLVSPVDVALEWKGVPNAAGHAVEFATSPEGTYTNLDYVLAGKSAFQHPNLVPETHFYYRVRAFYGPTSSALDVPLPAPPPGEDIEKMDHSWTTPQTIASGSKAPTHSIRGASTSPDAAPTDFRAKVMHSSGILFTWTDRAADEDGYFLEVRPDGSADFKVVAVLDANINSTGLRTLPNEKRAAYRVRAFYFGAASNRVDKTTGAPPAQDTQAKPEGSPAPRS
jgi:hypothetical protein